MVTRKCLTALRTGKKKGMEKKASRSGRRRSKLTSRVLGGPLYLLAGVETITQVKNVAVKRCLNFRLLARLSAKDERDELVAESESHVIINGVEVALCD